MLHDEDGAIHAHEWKVEERTEARNVDTKEWRVLTEARLDDARRADVVVITANGERLVFELKRADPVREGIVDVLSMRGLARAFRAIVSPPKDAFDRALTRTLNTTGSIAADMQRERG